jgi:N-dimethylarginine dimethylaminohydrolase
VISLRLVDSRFYHLDTCFCPLANGEVMYYPPAFDAESQTRIERIYANDKRVPVAEPDALRFACNAVNIGNKIVVNRISDELATALGALGYEVIQVELAEFLKAGGAAKCLALRLSEMDVTHRM